MMAEERTQPTLPGDEILEYNTYNEFVSRYPRLVKYNPIIVESLNQFGEPFYTLTLHKTDPTVSTTFNSNVLALLVAHKVPNPEDKFYEILAMDLYKQMFKEKIIDELPEWMTKV